MHWAWAVAQTPFDAAARQSFTRAGAASHLASPSRLQVARQSYILEVSHIHLCDWRRSLCAAADNSSRSRIELLCLVGNKNDSS